MVTSDRRQLSGDKSCSALPQKTDNSDTIDYNFNMAYTVVILPQIENHEFWPLIMIAMEDCLLRVLANTKVHFSDIICQSNMSSELHYVKC